MDTVEETWDDDFELEDSQETQQSSSPSLGSIQKIVKEEPDFEFPSINEDSKASNEAGDFPFRLRAGTGNNIHRDKRMTIVGLDASGFEKENWDTDLDIIFEEADATKLGMLN
jgi:hypothetical protein